MLGTLALARSTMPIAASRSCTRAQVIATASSRPNVSVTRCRLRPSTFTPPADVEAETASLCGDLNGWDASAKPRERAADGSLSVVVEFDVG